MEQQERLTDCHEKIARSSVPSVEMEHREREGEREL
jgi:hypothetical protein